MKELTKKVVILNNFLYFINKKMYVINNISLTYFNI